MPSDERGKLTRRPSPARQAPLTGGSHATLALLCLWRVLPPAVPGNLRSPGRLCGQLPDAEVDRFAVHQPADGRGPQSTVAGPVRRAAFDHGPAVVQEALDAPDPGADRAEHLCPAVLRGAVAVDVA